MMPSPPKLLPLLLLLHSCGGFFFGADVRRAPACNPAGLSMRGNQILAPRQFDANSLGAWLAKMRQMRTQCQRAIGYNGSMFRVPELEWTQTAYMGPQAHPYDRYFYDPNLGNGTGGAGYTVDRWLDDLASRYGKITHVLLWATYPNLGIDDRNLYQLTRSLPGGAAGFSVAVDQLHERGVHVLLSYLGWDTGTHGPASTAYRNSEWDPQQMAQLMKETHVDGFNGDGGAGCTAAFYEEAARVYKPVAMEGEGGLSRVDAVDYDTYGWAEGYLADDPQAVKDAPFVDRPKWLSDSKSMQVWSDRYSGSPESRDETPGIYSPASLNQSLGVSKITEIQVCWFNGQGYETWENVWGVWNGITARDGEALRRIGILLRFFGLRGFLTSLEWVPFTTAVQEMDAGVFGSEWPLPSGHETLYTIINRKAQATTAHVLLESRNETMKYYDCYLGQQLHPAPAASDAPEVSVELEPWGFGCIVATNNGSAVGAGLSSKVVGELRTSHFKQPENLSALLRTMAALTAKPLASFSTEWAYLKQTMTVSPSVPARPLLNATSDEVYVPGNPKFSFKASSVEIEGAAGSGVGVQFPFEKHPQRSHSQVLQIGAMYVDKYPVTNAQYHAYLEASGYRPEDTSNWLKQNFVSGEVRPGWEQRPVTYVSVQDARHYCAYHRKRLPQAFEWQYFAQGTDGRVYPWGNADDPSRTPVLQNNHTNPGPDPIGLHPQGASTFGVHDLISSVWQITSTFEDAHTASVVLRGGSNYAPRRDAHANKGNWYFRQTPRLDSFGVLNMMSPSYDRAGTISFRCVADAVEDTTVSSHGASDPPSETECNTQLCLKSTTNMCPAGVAMASCTTDLSRAGVIDWAHFGSLNASLRGPPWMEPLGEWHIVKKASGLNQLVPRLRMPGCTTTPCDLNTTDLRTWPSQLGWPSDRAVFSWNNGAPTAVAPSTARAGVFSNVGKFELVVPAPPAGHRPRVLTLYLGLFNWRGDLPFVKQALLRVSAPGEATISQNITHLDGNNNDIKNMAATIVYTKEITVSYELPHPDLVCNIAVGTGSATVWQHNLCSFVALQAATIEEYHDAK